MANKYVTDEVRKQIGMQSEARWSKSSAVRSGASRGDRRS